jgi:hypothetical protein
MARCRKILSNFDTLKITTQRIKNLLLQEKIISELERLNKKIIDFNANVDDVIFDDIALKQQVKAIQADLSNEIAGLKDFHEDNSDKEIASKVLNAVIKSCDEACPSSDLLNQQYSVSSLESHWQEHRLRMEQQLITNSPLINTAFSNLLIAIAKRAKTGNYKIPNGIFISYAWPDDKMEQDRHLNWVQPFLRKLYEHIKAAGLNTVKLDICDTPPGANIHAYMKQAGIVDFVLLIGTESLLRKHEQGVSAVCSELVKINRQRKENANYHVLPILLSGQIDTSFPAYFEMYTSISDWKDKNSYFKNLQWLLAALYGQTIEAFTTEWQSFYQSLETLHDGNAKVLIEGLTKESVIRQLEKEDKDSQHLEQKSTIASLSLFAQTKFNSQAVNYKLSPIQSFEKEIKERLKANYRKHAEVVRLYDGRCIPVTECFINLQFVDEPKQKEREKEWLVKSRDQRTPSYEEIYNINSETIAPETIFKSRKQTESKLSEEKSKPLNRVLIWGRAGIGKSTVCQYYAARWADEKQESALWKNKFKWLFWIPLRMLADPGKFPNEKGKQYTIEDIITTCCFNEVINDNKKSEIAQLLKTIYAQDILWILDGWDEIDPLEEHVPHLKQMVLSLLQQDNVVITSRPHAILPLRFDPEQGFQQLENIGFSTQNVKDYIQRFFSTLISPKIQVGKLLEESLLKQPIIWAAAHIPINLELICSLWLYELSQPESKPPEFSNMTELYESIIIWLLRRYHGQQSHRWSRNTVYKQSQPFLAFLEELAFASYPNLALGRKLIEAILDKHCAGDIKLEEFIILNLGKIGLLTPVTHYTVATDNTYYFIHATFHEFLAAKYLARQITQIKDITRNENLEQKIYSTEKFIELYKYNPRYQMILGFVSGLLAAEVNKAHLNSFFVSLHQEPRDVFEIYHYILMVKCLEEARCHQTINILESIVSELKNWMQTSFWLMDEGQMQFFKMLNISPIVTHKLNFFDYLSKALRTYGTKDKAIQAAGFFKSLPDEVLTIILNELKSGNEQRIIVETLKNLRLTNSKIVSYLLNTLDAAPDNEIKSNAKSFAHQFKHSFGGRADIIQAFGMQAAYKSGTLKSSIVLCLAELNCFESKVIDSIISQLNHVESHICYSAKESLKTLIKNANALNYIKNVTRANSDYWKIKTKLNSIKQALALIEISLFSDADIIDLLIDFISNIDLDTYDGSLYADFEKTQAEAIKLLGYLGKLCQPIDQVKSLNLLLDVLENKKYNSNYQVPAAIFSLNELFISEQNVIEKLMLFISSKTMDRYTREEYVSEAIILLGKLAALSNEAKRLELVKFFLNLVANPMNDKFMADAIGEAIFYLNIFDQEIISILKNGLDSNGSGSYAYRVLKLSIIAVGALRVNDEEIIKKLEALISKEAIVTQSLLLIKGFEYVFTKVLPDARTFFKNIQNSQSKKYFNNLVLAKLHQTDLYWKNLIDHFINNSGNLSDELEVIWKKDQSIVLKVIERILDEMTLNPMDNSFRLNHICSILLKFKILNFEFHLGIFNSFKKQALNQKEYTKNYRSFTSQMNDYHSDTLDYLSQFDLSKYFKEFDSISTIDFIGFDSTEKVFSSTPTKTLLEHFFLIEASNDAYARSYLAIVMQRWMKSGESLFLQQNKLFWYEGPNLFHIPLSEGKQYLVEIIKKVLAEYYDYKSRNTHYYLPRNLGDHLRKAQQAGLYTLDPEAEKKQVQTYSHGM